MEGTNAGEAVVGVGGDGATGGESAVVHALYFVRRNNYKPGVFVGIILVFIIKSEITIGPELDFQIKKIAGFGALDYKIRHKAQGFAGGVVVFAEHGAQERMDTLKAVVENVVIVTVKQILYHLFCHAAFEGVEVESVV